MYLLISILSILLTILLIVGIHEFGHFIVARLVGVKVLRFSIGFGKTLFRWHDKKGTEYVFAAIPLGGYVKMLDESEDNINPTELPYAYNRQPIYKRLAIVTAGPVFNFLFAFLIYWFLFIIGFTTIVPLIGKVLPNSIAAQAELQARQEITRIDDAPTASWNAVILNLLFHVGNKEKIQLSTKNSDTHQVQQHTLDLTHWQIDDLKPDPLLSLGIEPYLPTSHATWPKELLRENKANPLAAISRAYQSTSNLLRLNFLVFSKLVTGKLSIGNLGGPISIFESAGTALNSGMVPFLGFLAFLSIAIGFINILPIPGLDGGHVLFQLIEWVIGRPISMRTQALCYRIGFILLLLLLTQALVNDLMRL